MTHDTTTPTPTQYVRAYRAKVWHADTGTVNEYGAVMSACGYTVGVAPSVVRSTKSPTRFCQACWKATSEVGR